MSDELVEVRMRDDYPIDYYRGICGFHISRGEIKSCPLDVFQHGFDALERVDLSENDEKKEEVISNEPISKNKKQDNRGHRRKRKK